MNILPFVFAILFILSYGIGASFQNQIVSHRNQKANLGLLRAERRFLQQSEMEQFKTLPGIKVKSEKREKNSSSSKEAPLQEVPLPEINPSCARLNLFPLIAEGKEAHLPLYETAAKLLRTFYQAAVFGSEKQFEYKLLDNLLASAKKQLKEKEALALETLFLKEAQLQPIYYVLLKGTKKRFPSLLDYLKIERTPSQICLFHAHPKIMTVFFEEKTAHKLYQKLHGNKKEPMGLEAILQWANDPHLAFVDAKVWELIDFNGSKHGSPSQKTLVAEDDETHISIRKNIQVKNVGN